MTKKEVLGSGDDPFKAVMLSKSGKKILEQIIGQVLGESVEILPKDGVNVKLFFADENSESHLITTLARKLDIDFDICQGKLENFRGSILGSLIINIQEEDRDKVFAFLKEHHIIWEELQHE